MPEPWFERLERDQATTGYVQQTAPTSPFPEVHPNREQTLRTIPITNRPITPSPLTRIANLARKLAKLLLNATTQPRKQG